MMNRIIKRVRRPARFSYGLDPDAELFLTNNGTIGNTIIRNAVNEYVLDIKDFGLYSKYRIIYLYVGGSDTSHKYNLIDPRDADAAFRITWNGGWVHSSTGAKPNGINAWGDTHFNPSLSDLTANNICTSIYLRDEDATLTYSRPFSCIQNEANANRILAYHHSGDGSGYYEKINTAQRLIITNATYGAGYGLLTLSRTSSTSFKVYRNSTVKGTTAAFNALALPNANMQIGGGGSPANDYFSNQEECFFSVQEGFTDADVINHYTAIQTLQTSLSRNVS